MVTVAPKIWTVEEFLALPDDGRSRELIYGRMMIDGRFEDETDEEGEPVTIRNLPHSETMANIATELNNWRRLLPAPRGTVVCGEAGVRLPSNPPAVVGVDVAYVPAPVLAQRTGRSTIIEGVPALIAEILSPSNTTAEIDDRLDLFTEIGVPLVWVANPRRRTVTVYRLGEAPVMVNAAQELDGGDVLPGFRCPVVRLFE